MTKTKFIRQAEALGLHLYGTPDGPRAVDPTNQRSVCAWRKDGACMAQWLTCRREHPSILSAIMDLERFREIKIITDPIIRAAHGMEP